MEVFLQGLSKGSGGNLSKSVGVNLIKEYRLVNSRQRFGCGDFVNLIHTSTNHYWSLESVC